MKQKVWILNHYASDTYSDNGGRHYNFAKYLKRFGHDPVIFCCNAKHNSNAGVYFDDNSLWHEHIAEGIDVPFVFVRGRAYVGNGKQRVLNMIDFYRNVKKTAKEYAKENGKPGVILASSVHPLTLVAGIQLAKHFGVKCICEVRDLWPESIVKLSSRWKKSNPLIKLLYLGEKWIYKKADALIFTMEGSYNYIIEQGWEKDIPHFKVHYINNGVDLEVFDYNKERYQIDDPDLKDPDIFKVLYAGSLRKANGIGLLVECAEKLKDFHNIRFLIYGAGEDEDAYKEECISKGIQNCIFKGSVEKKFIPFVLSKSNVNILNYDLKVKPLYRYGSSQNKLFEYLASRKPVVSNMAISYSPITQYQCGVARDLFSAEDYANAILEVYHLSAASYTEMCNASREAAKEYDFKLLTEKLVGVIDSLKD